MDPPLRRWARVRWIPAAAPQRALSTLERRLAALSASLDRRLRIDAALVTFDVEGLAAAIEAELARVSGRAAVSVHVRDLPSGHVLFDHYGDTPLTPASTQKLLTGAAALDLLGPDFRFHTRALQRPGAIVLWGEGDPLLQVEDVQQLARRVAAAVPAAQFEQVIVDDSLLPTSLPAGYDEDGPGFAYQAPASALAVNFDTVEVIVVPSGSGRPRVFVDPACGAIVVKNRARMGRSDTVRVRTRGQGRRTVVEVTGTMSRGSRPLRVRRRLADPAFVTGTLFAEALAREGAKAPAVERGRRLPTDVPVAEHRSPPLSDILEQGLAYSNNFVAEQVLRAMARRFLEGEAGDAAGVEVLEAYSSALGIDPDAVTVENGSGLSRRARISSRNLVDLIAAAHRAQAQGPTLIDLLPVAGHEGTLRSRLRTSGRRVRAKTGTLDGVSGLAGVVAAEDGTPRIGFAVLVNAVEGEDLSAAQRRRMEDRIVLAVLRALDDYEARRSGLRTARPP